MEKTNEQIVNIHFVNGEILYNCTVLEMKDNIIKAKDSQESIVYIERHNINYIVCPKKDINNCFYGSITTDGESINLDW